jgi:phospholipase A1
LPGDAGSDSAEDRYESFDLDPFEMQFQLSVQVPIWSGLLGETSFISLAYTNRSFWQAYASSGPFRETNHEPELIATWLSDWKLFGLQSVATQLAINHQSNGRSGKFSRGWNRLYANFIFEQGNYFVSFKPWYRIPNNLERDGNPDLEFYFGHFELGCGYRSGGYSSSIMLRNNLRSENRGAVELGFGFPITNRVRGFVKYFDGYGESLIDYQVRVRTLGVGLELATGF